MNIKEMIEEEKKRMSSLRRFINYTLIPIWLAAFFLPILLVIILMTIDAVKFMPAFIVVLVWCVLLIVAILIAIPFITKKETQMEIERYGYLFQEPKRMEKDSLEVLDEGLIYQLDEKGARAEFPMEDVGQVFDEARENVFFIPWDRAEVSLATQTYLRRVYIALAVFPLDEEAPPFFIPFNEEVYAFIKHKQLDKQLGATWLYIFYNREDAFQQMLNKGRILKMRNKKTGKLFVDKHGNFIGDKE